MTSSRKRSALALHIHAGMTIFGDGRGAYRGVLGAIAARRSDGALIGITAAQIVPGLEVRQLYSPLLIGKRIDLKSQQAGIGFGLSIVATIALFQIEKLVHIEGGALQSPHNCKTADLVEALGHRVRKLGSDSNPVWGRLTGIGCALNLNDSISQAIRTYSGACEIALPGPADDFATTGDAGAPVVTEAGDLVGFVVGATDTRCFIVPASSVFSAEDIRLATSEDIALHNADIEYAVPAAAASTGSANDHNDIDRRWPIIAEFRRALAAG
jgi:hypothetical protein